MADDAVFSSTSPSKGPPAWLIIGGAGVGIIALVMIISRNSSGGTIAAGSSINAALGSLAEEQQNLLGTVQSGALANSTNFGSVNGEIAGVSGQINDLQTLLNNEFGKLETNIGQNQQDILTQFNTLSTQQQNLFNQVNSQFSTIENQQSQMQGLMQQMQNATGSQLTDLQNKATALQASIDQNGAALNDLMNSNADILSQNSNLASMVSAIGRFMGWEFYQIPNRYAAFIPNQGPGGLTPGSSVIGSV